jgi:hypothetical protein
MPARCQLSPNSTPPRSVAIAHTPPISIHVAVVAENDGLIATLKPP